MRLSISELADIDPIKLMFIYQPIMAKGIMIEATIHSDIDAVTPFIFILGLFFMPLANKGREVSS